MFFLASIFLFVIGIFIALWCSRCSRYCSIAGGILLLAAGLFETLLSPSLTSGSLYRTVIGLIGLASALHAKGYLEKESCRRQRYFWFFFNSTLAAMSVVTVVRHFTPFIVAWEIMGLASFALVAFEFHEKKCVHAAWIYLLGCEAGGLLLMLASMLYHTEHCSATPYFYMLLAGFGLKIGFPILHVWLPEAHPAAPAPVSALMSAAMIPLGFCGLMRFMPYGATIAAHCGWSLMILGNIGAIGGILFALSQQNLKRMLAYSSVENMGIISMGLAFGFLGISYNLPAMSVLGFSGGLLHILNHALLKGTLFLGAGSVLKSTGTLNLDQMGGLMKAMPKTGKCFTWASLGICGLPPFCGFTSELLIYIGAFTGITQCSRALFAGSLATAIILALTGGFACTALSKATGAAFLGEPRSECAQNATSETTSMVLPQMIMLILALIIPLAGFFLTYIPFFADRLEVTSIILRKNAVLTAIAYIIFALIWFLRAKCGSDKRSVGTWDCGYARPTARMEYTGTAFSQPLTDQFHILLGKKRTLKRPDGLFPNDASLEEHDTDLGQRAFWMPIFKCVIRLAEYIHRFQSGYLHLYILIMVLALAAMMVYAIFG